MGLEGGAMVHTNSNIQPALVQNAGRRLVRHGLAARADARYIGGSAGGLGRHRGGNALSRAGRDDGQVRSQGCGKEAGEGEGVAHLDGWDEVSWEVAGLEWQGDGWGLGLRR